MTRSIILCFALALQAQGQFSDPAFVASLNARTNAGAAGSVYLISEDCEGTGTPSGWTDAGSPDWDNATSPAPLVGSQSLMTPSESDSVTKTFTAQTNVWFFCAFNQSTGTSPYVCAIYDVSDVQVAAVRLFADGSVRVYNDSGSYADTAVGTVTYPGTFYVWLHYQKGTGANSVGQIYVSATTTKPGSPSAEFSVGAATTDAVKLVMWGPSSGDMVRDYIRLSATTIGSAPD